MPSRQSQNPLFDLLRTPRHQFRAEEIVTLFRQVSEQRVDALSANLSTYISTNLPNAIDRRSGLAEYRTNPYVLLTSANVMQLSDPQRFADFLFNNKLYAGLETSFGKSIEAAFVGPYPINAELGMTWKDAPEKDAESAALVGLSREQRARVRTQSVWREIDKSCVVGNRRYLTSIKSGPNCINDTQVQAMTTAIIQHHREWLRQTGVTYPGVNELDVVIGITYGTDRTTNNKENQILVKLLEHGFEREDSSARPGVIIDQETRTVRVYREIGKDFWSFIGKPSAPQEAQFVFLEVLLALARALSQGMGSADLESRINAKILALTQALGRLMFPRASLPDWVREEFSEDQLFWFATAMSAFYDEGI
jgi:hypothetical protein